MDLNLLDITDNATQMNPELIPIDKDGFVKLDKLKEAITDQTILITVMLVNNEIGTIQPIPEIGAAHCHVLLIHIRCQFILQPVDIDKNSVQFLFIGFQCFEPFFTFRLP